MANKSVSAQLVIKASPEKIFDLAKVVKQLREKTGLSKERLARLADVSNNTIETLKKSPKRLKLALIIL